MKQNDCSRPQSKLKLARNSGRLPRWCSGRESGYQCRRSKRPSFDFWVGKILWSRKLQPTQYSFLENSMDRRAWRATVHGVTKSQDVTEHTHTEKFRSLLSKNSLSPHSNWSWLEISLRTLYGERIC